MSRERGFLMLDMLTSVMIIGIASSAIFPLVAMCRRQEALASLDLAAAAAAEALITSRSLSVRSLANPQGPPPEAGEERTALLAGGRSFTAVMIKEVVPSCAGLFRWRITLVPAGEPGSLPPGAGVRFLAGCYDPF